MEKASTLQLFRVCTQLTENTAANKLENEFIKINAVSLSKMCRHGNQAWLCFEIHPGHTAFQMVGGISIHTLAHTSCAQTHIHSHMQRPAPTNAHSNLNQIPFHREGGSVVMWLKGPAGRKLNEKMIISISSSPPVREKGSSGNTQGTSNVLSSILLCQQVGLIISGKQAFFSAYSPMTMESWADNLVARPLIISSKALIAF